MTPDQADALLGVPRGTARGWQRTGVLSPDPGEHEVYAVYTLRPATAVTRVSPSERLEDEPGRTAGWSAAVRASLDRAAEAACPTTVDPAAAAAAA